eukprot:1854696-Amphidinium_carterae.1
MDASLQVIARGATCYACVASLYRLYRDTLKPWISLAVLHHLAHVDDLRLLCMALCCILVERLHRKSTRILLRLNQCSRKAAQDQLRDKTIAFVAAPIVLVGFSINARIIMSLLKQHVQLRGHIAVELYATIHNYTFESSGSLPSSTHEAPCVVWRTSVTCSSSCVGLELPDLSSV